MRLIVISGHAQHGKDTVGQIMKTKLTRDGHSVLITHYADLLKFICQSYFGWDGEKNEYGRSLMQHVGTDIVRKQDKNFWVDFIAKVLTWFHSDWEYVIISDCRFGNEIYRLVELGFDVTHIRVNRADAPQTLTAEQANHPSETELDDVSPDYLIQNQGDIADLTDRVEKYIEEKLYER